MNSEKALRILNIKHGEYVSTNRDLVRKKYLKAALKYHPDKYHDNG